MLFTPPKHPVTELMVTVVAPAGIAKELLPADKQPVTPPPPRLVVTVTMMPWAVPWLEPDVTLMSIVPAHALAGRFWDAPELPLKL